MNPIELDKKKELEKIIATAVAQAVELCKINDEVMLSTLKAGQVFMIGEHQFIILEQSGDTTAVISKELMYKNKQFGECKDFNKSSIKNLLDTEVQPMIELELGEDSLIEYTADLTTVDNQKEFENCRTKVGLLTFEQARKYNDLLVDKNLNDWWWTCTPWSTSERGYKYGMSVVSPSGDVNNGDCNGFIGVRPFCILKSNIFVSKGEC